MRGIPSLLVVEVAYVPFYAPDGSYDHALRHTKLPDGTYYVEAIGGDEYRAICESFPYRDGLIHDRTQPD